MNELIITVLNDHKEPYTTIITEGHFEIRKENDVWIVKKIYDDIVSQSEEEIYE